MPFYFTCPYCFKKTLVDEAIAGQSGPCANCGKKVTVPAAPAKLPPAIRPADNRTIAKRPQIPLLVWGLKVLGLVVGVCLVGGLSFYLLWPTFVGLKARRDKVASLNNLQRIAEALNAYALEHGTYPPPVVLDANGRPLYSWRILILEQLGETSLAARFRRDLPWDDVENANLLSLCPSVYFSPSTISRRTGAECNYALVTGNNTLFPASGPLRLGDIKDGRERTLLVVETTTAGSNEWSKPWDIEVGKLNTKIGSRGSNSIGGSHEGGAAVAFADGNPAWLPSDLSPTLLRAMISPSGGEPIRAEDFWVK